jgi:hypothetical protein
MALGVALATGAAQAAGPSRFASYDSEADCVAAHTLTPSVCHSAFANARAEYEAKTPSFASRALCIQRFASCMAWPPGSGDAKASFRPTWDGVDVVDTPSEHSVTPSPTNAVKGVRFAARPLTEEPAPLVIRGATVPVPLRRPGEAPLIAGHPGRPSDAPALVQRAGGPERDLPPSAKPPPGSGFKLEDGVLTYPAPARFQPKNLPKE